MSRFIGGMVERVAVLGQSARSIKRSEFIKTPAQTNASKKRVNIDLYVRAGGREGGRQKERGLQR